MHFREATATDRERILALRTRCFGDVDPEKADPRFWDWEFSRARMFVGVLTSSSGSSGSSEFLGVEEDEARVNSLHSEEPELATHLAMLDLPHMLDGRQVNGALAVDAMTLPSARGQGAFTGVVRYAAEHNGHTIATAYQIRKPVLGAMLRGGWAVAERVPVLIRPIIRLSRTRVEDRHSCLSSSSSPAAGERRGGQAGVPVLHSDDVWWMSGLGLTDGCVARTPEFLSWRFFENPHWRYRVTGIRERAYLVTRRTTLKGFDTLSIVDLAFRDRRAARLLLRDAIAHARVDACTLAAAFVSRKHPAFWMFVRAGFLPGPHWFRLLVHPPEQAKRTWRVMWADTDHL